MLAFWETYWLYSLFMMFLLLAVWTVLLLFARWLSLIGEGYDETALERRLSRLRWIANTTKFPIPHPEPTTPCAKALAQRHRIALDRIDTASRALFAPANFVGWLLFLSGGAQLVWTSLALSPLFSPWETLSVSALLISIVPFLLTMGTFQKVRARRMPFELRYLESASWASHNIQKVREAKRPEFLYGQLRDLERILLSRYQDREFANLPSYAVAAGNWVLHLAPILESRANLLARAVDPALAQAWIDEATEIVCRPPSTASATPYQRRIALAATRAKPKNVFAVSGIVTLTSVLAGLLGLLVSLEFNFTPLAPIDIPDYLGAAAAIVAIVGTTVTLSLTLAERLKRPSRHLVEILMQTSET
jgi:hypothetical protein